MAYKTIVNLAALSLSAFLTDLRSQLLNMGWLPVDVQNISVTVFSTDVSIADDRITVLTGQPFVEGQAVRVSTTTTLPSPLSALVGQAYYIKNASYSTFQLASTQGGAALNITTQGVGYHTFHGDQSIYSSDGESSDRIREYVRFYICNPTTIYFEAYHLWDAVSNVGYGKSYYSGILTVNNTGFYYWIHGNKDKVFITVKCVSSYTRAIFGHLKPFLTLKTSLTEPVAISPLIAVNISVLSTVGFEAGYSYQLIGANGEGRDTVIVAAVYNATILTIIAPSGTLPRSFSAGSQIGLQPSTFGVEYYSYWSLTCPINATGLVAASSVSSNITISPMFTPTNINPDGRTNKFILTPLVYSGGPGGIGIGVYSDEYLFCCPPKTGVYVEDTFTVDALSYGTAGVNNSYTTLTDASKTWIVNAFIDKVVVITFGLGQGLIKKIASNTATQLTLADGWIFEIIPNSTSQYVVCEEAYRYLGEVVTTYGAYSLREGV